MTWLNLSFIISIFGCICTILGVFYAGSRNMTERKLGFAVALLGSILWITFYFLVGWETMVMAIIVNVVLFFAYLRGAYNNCR
jgi:hypothetical protein